MSIGAAPVSTDTVSIAITSRDRVRIVVPIEVIGGSEALLRKWQAGIDEAWNRPNDGHGYDVCGRPVVFEPRLRLSPTPGHAAHHVFVVHSKGAVSRVSYDDGSSPVDTPRTAHWSSSLAPSIAAHEFGHLLGLPDEYLEDDRNGNGFRDPGEHSVPDIARYPDAWHSLMGYERGHVLLRHVDAVLRLHGVSTACPELRPVQSPVVKPLVEPGDITWLEP